MSEKSFPLLRRHRRAGVIVALVVLLAGFGLAQHPGRIPGLDRLSVLTGAWQAPAAPAGLVQALPGGALAAVDGRLRMGGRDLGACRQLLGVVEQGDRVLAVCGDRQWLLTAQGEGIRQVDSVRDLPEGLSAAAQAQGRRRQDVGFSVDLGDLSLRPAVPVPGVSPRRRLPPA